MDYLMINGTRIWQPDEGLGYSFETTYSEDTQRVITGPLVATPLFTVEQVNYSAQFVPVSEASRIIQMIAKGNEFQLHYFSLYYGTWRTDTFYVGRGNAAIGRLDPATMELDSLTFNMTGVNPL